MNHKGTKPMDYQAKLIIPVDVALKHQYGLLNNVIHMDIPIKNTRDTIVINIEVENINSMAIKKIYANKKIEVKMKKFYIYNTQGELVEIIDSVEKAFEFLDNEGGYKVEKNKRKNEN